VKSLFLAAVALSVLALSSCNTMIGVGRDLRLLGEGMETKARSSGGSADQQQSGAPVY
jgi:predicted small secreted protein